MVQSPLFEDRENFVTNLPKLSCGFNRNFTTPYIFYICEQRNTFIKGAIINHNLSCMGLV